MNAQTFVAGLLPLHGDALKRYIAEHTTEVDDLEAAVSQLKDAAQAQETQNLKCSAIITYQLLALARWTGSPLHLALGWLALGNVWMRRGHHRAAIGYFDTAGAQFLAVGNDVGWARTRISYLWSASQVGLTTQALGQAERAREILLRDGEQKRAGDLDIAIALALVGLGQYPEAITTFERALQTYQPGDPKEAAHHRAVVLVNKGIVLGMLGDLSSALACEQEARAIFAEHGELTRVAWIDNNLAVENANRGQYSAALHLYYRALEYYRHHPQLRSWEALCQANIAECLLRLNRAPEALHRAMQAVAIYRTLDETPNFGWALMEMASAQAACGKGAAALDTLAEARECFESIGAVATCGLVLLTLADLLLLLKQQAESLDTVEQARAIFRHFGMKKWTIEADLLTGRIYETSGDLTQARILAEQACLSARESGHPWLEFGCESLLGRLAQRQGNIEQAERHYDTALNLLEGLMTWLVRDQRSTFLSDKENLFSALISLALHRQNTNKALDYLERLKSQVLREYLTRSDKIRLRTADPDEARLLVALHHLRQELQGYTAQITAIEQQQQQTLLLAQKPATMGFPASPGEPAPQGFLLEQLRAKQRHAEQEISHLLEQAFLQQESKRFAVLPTPGARRGNAAEQAPALAASLAELLPAGCVLLEYFLQGEDMLIFTVHSHNERAEVTIIPDVATTLTQQLLPLFRASIDMAGQQLLAQPASVGVHTALATNLRGRSRQLYNLLLRPIETHIPPDGRLLIVPYGPLHLLPFHALQSDQGYLLERCEVAYLPAAAMLALQERRHSGWQKQSNQRTHALVLGHSYHGRLPYALHEAQKVAELLGGQVHIEAEATIARLQGENGPYSIIHLAAHGKNRAEAPDFSYLELADGRLSVVDIFNLDLPAELVTLSGCETGLAVIGGGDELLGLGRGFLYAGARSLLMSLWNVEDASTAELMGHFYRGLLAGQSRAGALRAAQLALIALAKAEPDRAAWAHPFFWAPFKLLGDANPIVF